MQSCSGFKYKATTAKCFLSAKANRLTALNDTLPKNNCILHYHSFHTVMKTDSQTYRQTQRETEIDKQKKKKKKKKEIDGQTDETKTVPPLPPTH